METILALARVPSFTSWEERLHPFIRDFCADLPDVQINEIAYNNLVLGSAAARTAPPLALSAHLDKINHFGDMNYEELTAERLIEDGRRRLHGLLDDAVGVGVCLHMLRQAVHAGWPLQVLLSECEESSMFRTPHLLRQPRAERLSGGYGARQIADFLIKNEQLPAALVVIDVTPLFRGRPGVALYEKPWQLRDYEAPRQLKQATTHWVEKIMQCSPRIKIANNTNDYLTYASHFHHAGRTVPCMALEPSIENYHSAEEKVYEQDILEVTKVLRELINWRP